MRFSVQLPTHRVDRLESFITPEAIAGMAKAAEDAGFDALNVTDHPFPTDAWMESGGHHALDPFVALSFAAAATERIRLHTYLLVLPYRNAFITAKSIASLDVLSRGRLIIGVATGYLEGEFDALGADFKARNDVSDESLAAMRLAFSGDSTRFEGRGFLAEGNHMLPRPTQQPAPPVWVGGNSLRAIRRVAEHGQGWMPFPSAGGLAERTRTAVIANEEDLRSRVQKLREAMAAAGREGEDVDICMVPFDANMYAKTMPSSQELVDGLGRLAEIGVTWTTTMIPAQESSEFIEGAQRYAEEVVAKMR